MNTENICCFICKRAIYKHFKIIMPVNKAFCFYLSDKIQHLLRSSHCKRGNYHITAPVKGATLIGNGPEAMSKVSMVGNDLSLDSGVGTCGKDGQSVPVGVGQPTLKIDAITVGGTGS